MAFWCLLFWANNARTNALQITSLSPRHGTNPSREAKLGKILYKLSWERRQIPRIHGPCHKKNAQSLTFGKTLF